MSKKYHTAPTSSTIITNDLFLAAFLYTVGCPLSRMERNDRRRVSFVFTGKRVRELREAYRTGPVELDIRSFRGLRDRLGETVTSPHPEERSSAHASNGQLSTSEHRERTHSTRHPTYSHA